MDQKDSKGEPFGLDFEGFNLGGLAIVPGDKEMTESLKRIFSRYFKFYFAFCLLGFTLLILLMNLPRVLADNPKISRDKAPAPAPVEYPQDPPIVSVSIPKKFYQWDLPISQPTHSMTRSSVQFTGSTMKFNLIF